MAVFGATTVAVLATLPALGDAMKSAMRDGLTLAARADVDPWRAASMVAARVVAATVVATVIERV